MYTVATGCCRIPATLWSTTYVAVKTVNIHIPSTRSTVAAFYSYWAATYTGMVCIGFVLCRSLICFWLQPWWVCPVALPELETEVVACAVLYWYVYQSASLHQWSVVCHKGAVQDTCSSRLVVWIWVWMWQTTECEAWMWQMMEAEAWMRQMMEAEAWMWQMMESASWMWQMMEAEAWLNRSTRPFVCGWYAVDTQCSILVFSNRCLFTPNSRPWSLMTTLTLAAKFSKYCTGTCKLMATFACLLQVLVLPIHHFVQKMGNTFSRLVGYGFCFRPLWENSRPEW